MTANPVDDVTKTTNAGDQPEPLYASDSTIARFIALQTLYEVDVANHDALEVLARHLQMQAPPGRAARLARRLVIGVNTYRDLIDGAIERRAAEFPVEQLAFIDRNILRIALFEFAVSGITPLGAAIDEAVELAKEFAAEGSPSFVNAVLRSIAQDAALVESLSRDDHEGGDEDVQT